MADAETMLMNYVVDADGSAVCLRGRDEHGIDFNLRLSVDQIGSLAMTLPGILQRAMRVRYRDESLRYVFSLGSWALETTPEASTLILSLTTTDGFTASFALSRPAIGDLAATLSEQDVAHAPSLRHRAN
jgi:hypothetical protein